MKKALFLGAGSGLVFLTPLVVSAQQGLQKGAENIAQIISVLVPAIFALAVLAFFWGLAMFLFSSSEDKKSQGKDVMIWSIVAMFVMVAIFGIIQVLGNTLGIDQVGGDIPAPIPTLPDVNIPKSN